MPSCAARSMACVLHRGSRPKRGIYPCAGHFCEAQGAADFNGHFVVANGKVLQRALGLSAPVAGGNINTAHTVKFFALALGIYAHCKVKNARRITVCGAVHNHAPIVRQQPPAHAVCAEAGGCAIECIWPDGRSRWRLLEALGSHQAGQIAHAGWNSPIRCRTRPILTRRPSTKVGPREWRSAGHP